MSRYKQGAVHIHGDTHMVLLTCGHTLTFNRAHLPHAWDELYCHRCRDMRAVEALQGEYHVKCRDCRYGRRCGAAKVSAETIAGKHAREKRHTVDVRLGGKVKWTSGKDNVSQLTIDDLETPPF